MDPKSVRLQNSIAAGSTLAPSQGAPRLLDQVRTVILRKHYSRRTEESYVGWIKRYILFHGKRHPLEMGEPEVTLFLNHLARDRMVAASTQNQALSALLFLYKEVLGRDLDWLTNLDRVKRPARVPTVLTALGGVSRGQGRFEGSQGRFEGSGLYFIRQSYAIKNAQEFIQQWNETCQVSEPIASKKYQ